MTLTDFNNIADIIASVAVIASLVYIARELKQNTEATQTAAAQAYVTADNETVGLINVSSSLADVLHQGANGLSALQGGDLIRFMAFHDQLFISFQSFYMQWRKGTLDENLWITYKQATLDLLTQRGQQEWWGLRCHWFNPEFCDYVTRASSAEVGKPMHPGAVAG